eukprot:243099_1
MASKKQQTNKPAIIAFIILIIGLAFVIMNTSSHKDLYSEIQFIHEQSYLEDISSIFSTINTNIKPLRTYKHKISAIEQFIHGNGKMIMFHYSSCCKSTLTEWFHRIQLKLKKLHIDDIGKNKWNSSIKHIEIKHNFHETFSKTIKQLLQSNIDNTVFIICFGNPIKRILSQYDKEWRWGCPQTEGCDAKTYMLQYNKSLLTMNNYLTLTDNHPDFNLKPTERFAAIDFNDFLYRIVKFEIEQKSLNDKLYQMFLNNYYLWSFCCLNEECNMARNFEFNGEKLKECIIDTMNVIKAFDFVFIKDWIQDLRVQHYVNELFFVDNNVDDQKNKFVAVAKKKYNVPKIGINYMYDPDNEELLKILNKYDMKLVEWIQDLVWNRTHIVWERAKYNKNNRNELVYDLGYKEILRRSDNVTY